MQRCADGLGSQLAEPDVVQRKSCRVWIPRARHALQRARGNQTREVSKKHQTVAVQRPTVRIEDTVGRHHDADQWTQRRLRRRCGNHTGSICRLERQVDREARCALQCMATNRITSHRRGHRINTDQISEGRTDHHACRTCPRRKSIGIVEGRALRVHRHRHRATRQPGALPGYRRPESLPRDPLCAPGSTSAPSIQAETNRRVLYPRHPSHPWDHAHRRRGR